MATEDKIILDYSNIDAVLNDARSKSYPRDNVPRVVEISGVLVEDFDFDEDEQTYEIGPVGDRYPNGHWKSSGVYCDLKDLIHAYHRHEVKITIEITRPPAPEVKDD